MAKDGTLRGGARLGSGTKKKPLADKLLDGDLRGSEIVLTPLSASSILRGEEMPKPKEWLSEEQKDGRPLMATEIYEETWNWLNERGCARLIPPQLLERYAMSAARLIQCEAAVSEFGFIAKHPTTGGAMASPFVVMTQNYNTQTSRLWLEIFQIVKDNSVVGYGGQNPQDDVMERLLTARRGK